MLDNEIRERLEEQWASADQNYAQIKARSESIVARWEWATRTLYTLEPFGFEVERKSRGEVTADRPSRYGFHCQYGFDNQEKLIVARNYLSYPGTLTLKEDFRVYSGKDIVQFSYGYDPENELQCVKMALSNTEVIDAIGCLDADHFILSSYVYSENLLSQLVKQTISRYGSSKVKDLIEMPLQVETTEFQFLWDNVGLRRIDLLSNGHPAAAGTHTRPVYVRLQPFSKKLATETMAMLVASFTREAKAIIDQFIADYPDESWYSFILVYDNENADINCAFGTEAGLSNSVAQYMEQGYQFRRGNSAEFLTSLLRYSPWDGHLWRRLPAEGANDFLYHAWNEWIFRDSYNKIVTELCEKVLKRLDSDGAFGTGKKRKKIVIGVACGRKSRMFTTTALKLNPEDTIERLKSEFKQARKLSAPGMLEVVQPITESKRKSL